MEEDQVYEMQSVQNTI